MARDISSTRGFTRGGQVFKNNIMMFAQSANNILLLGLIVFAVSFVLGTFMFVQKWRLEILFGVLKASFMGWFNASSAMTFKVASHTFHATAHAWLANADIQGYMADLKVMLFHIGLIAFVIGVLSAGLTALYFRRTGISAIEEQYVRGPLLEDAKKVKNHRCEPGRGEAEGE